MQKLNKLSPLAQEIIEECYCGAWYNKKTAHAIVTVLDGVTDEEIREEDWTHEAVDEAKAWAKSISDFVIEVGSMQLYENPNSDAPVPISVGQAVVKLQLCDSWNYWEERFMATAYCSGDVVNVRDFVLLEQIFDSYDQMGVEIRFP